MKHQLTLEYWLDDGWYVGRLQQIPGVFSQGETLAELEENIRDAWRMLVQEMEPASAPDVQIKELVID